MNVEFCKTGFKAGEHTFSAVFWQWYLRLIQKYIHSAKKRKANAVKLVSKPNKTFLSISWQQYLRLTQNILESAKKRTANAVKQVSKQTNTVFRPYLDIGTTDRCKKTSKVLKKRTANAVKSF